MKLTVEEYELFFELTWALQFYVNNKKELIAGIDTKNQYRDLSQQDKYLVREAVYEYPELIDSYISENPDKLNKNRLNIIKNWKNFIKGDFYIERYLKKYAIFIGDEKVYGVMALQEGFDEIFPKKILPVYIKTVLLPFQGKLIYDGLMQTYNIFFGGGVKGSLRETYMRAKQNDRIITALGEDDNKKEKITILEKDWSQEIKQLRSVSKKLKGGSGQPVINSPVFSVVRAGIELANQAVVNLSDADTLLKELKKVERATNKLKTVLYRMD